jgi:hypothetical protein
MKQTTKYVALDVHQAITVAAVREQNDRVIGRSVLPTEAPRLVEFIGGMHGSIHVTFEEGTQSQWLQRNVNRAMSSSARASRQRFIHMGPREDWELANVRHIDRGALTQRRKMPTHPSLGYQIVLCLADHPRRAPVQQLKRRGVS